MGSGRLPRVRPGRFAAVFVVPVALAFLIVAVAGSFLKIDPYTRDGSS